MCETDHFPPDASLVSKVPIPYVASGRPQKVNPVDHRCVHSSPTVTDPCFALALRGPLGRALRVNHWIED